MKAPLLFRLALFLFAVEFLADMQLGHVKTYQALVRTALLFGIYFSFTFGSMILYRIFFHPSKRFPGPFLTKTSKLWHTFEILRKNNFEWLDRLHKEYGDVVRTGELRQYGIFC